MIKIIKTTILLAFMVSSCALAEQYKVTVKGQHAGDAILNIKQTANHYQAKLFLYPIFLAKIFGIDDMVESVVGTIKKGHYYPQHYQRREMEGKKAGKQLLSVTFLGSRATMKNEKEQTDFTIDQLAQDPLSQIIQISYDLKKNKLAKKYYLVTEKIQRLYRITKKNNHVVLTEQPSGDRIISLWFDKATKLLRMQKQKRGKIQFDMQKK